MCSESLSFHLEMVGCEQPAFLAMSVWDSPFTRAGSMVFSTASLFMIILAYVSMSFIRSLNLARLTSLFWDMFEGLIIISLI